jgi:uncharacterized protein YhfF
VTSIDGFWARYLATLPSDAVKPERYDTVSFGDSPEMADELGRLVVTGVKTATAAALWEYEHEGDEPPEAGDHSVVVDGAGEPLCVVETVDVTVVPFDEVDRQFAVDEGEGFESVADWRDAHWRFWSRTLPAIGRTPSEQMPVVCERFRVVYPERAQ